MGNQIKRHPQLFFRPVFYTAVYLTFGILIGYYLPTDRRTAFILLGICGLSGIILSGFYQRLSLLIMLLAAFGAGITLISFSQALESVPVGEARISGYVVDLVHYDTASYYTLDRWQAEADGEAISPRKKLRLRTKDQTLQIGDVVSFSGTITYPKTQRNLYGYNERQYLLSKSIGYQAKAGDAKIRVTGHIKGPNTMFYRVRRYMEGQIERHFSEETRGIAKGLILGDKSGISESDYDAYKIGGTASILAVSGLHFGIISLFFFWLMRLIGIGRKPANLITGIIMLFYAGVVGFSVSAVRALIMGWVVIIAGLLGRKKDYFSYLCTAYVISLVIRPISLFSVGFLLSFGAVYAILLLSPMIIKKIKFLPPAVSGTIAASVSAWLGTAPIMINFFNYVSLIGLLANLIIIPIAGLTVVLVLLSLVPGVIGAGIGFIAGQLISFMNLIMHGSETLPFAAVPFRNLPVVLIILWYGLIFIFSSEFKFNKRVKRITAILTAVAMAIMVVLFPFQRSNQMYLYFFDVGQGDAIFIHTPEDQCYMVDTGQLYEYDEIERFLSSTGSRLNGCF